jgi:hypothetical protein
VRLTGLAMLFVVTACAAPVPSSSAAETSSQSRSPVPTGGITRDEAVEIARTALREAGEDWDVVFAEAGPLERVRPDWQASEWGASLPGDLRVWRVVMVAGELSAEVVIDSADGSVYGSVIGIAN